MVRAIRALDMEACVTLGMLKPHQADRLAKAGLSAYNHNLDTSPEFYKQIITTRTYQDRLDTLEAVRNAGIEVCCGGIIGMGETARDRCSLLHQLAIMSPHPQSVPINSLVRVAGIPLENVPPAGTFDVVRMVATARLVMPKSRIRLSAGRKALGREGHLLCFLAGANSLFYGDKLLTTDNADVQDDKAMLQEIVGLKA